MPLLSLQDPFNPPTSSSPPTSPLCNLGPPPSHLLGLWLEAQNMFMLPPKSGLEAAGTAPCSWSWGWSCHMPTIIATRPGWGRGMLFPCFRLQKGWSQSWSKGRWQGWCATERSLRLGGGGERRQEAEMVEVQAAAVALVPGWGWFCSSCLPSPTAASYSIPR